MTGGAGPRTGPGAARRVAILGNAGGGKSTLARRLARDLDLPLHEIDGLLWRDGWRPAPAEAYEAAHARLLARPRWIIDGLGRRESIGSRIDRATTVVLVDLPLWQHFWLAAERQLAWAKGPIADAPGGQAAMPPTRDLFETIWTVDRDWMPGIRDAVAAAEAAGTDVRRVSQLTDRYGLRI